MWGEPVDDSEGEEGEDVGGDAERDGGEEKVENKRVDDEKNIEKEMESGRSHGQ
jgi:hypothetical protein